MRAFTFSVPTNVHFGKDVEQKAGELIKELGGSRVLVHYGSFAKKSGLVDRVTGCLAEAGLAVVQPAWIEHVWRREPKHFVQFAQRVWDVDPSLFPSEEANVPVRFSGV